MLQPSESSHHTNPLPVYYQDTSQSLPEVYHSQETQHDHERLVYNETSGQYESHHMPMHEAGSKYERQTVIAPVTERKMYGIRRKTFWIVVIVVLIAVNVAAVVGGVLRRKNKAVT
jgi:hypothetical protein